MIQVAPNRSQNGLIALAVLGIVAVLFVATYKPLPADPAASADASQITVATTSAPSARPTGPTAAPTARVTPEPTKAACNVPGFLPTDATSAAVPKVEGGAGSILFASPVYLPGSRGPVVAERLPLDWNMGLWFVRAPGTEPVLVTAAGRGMVIPLGLAPSGEVAAVWWWPERRGASEVPCEQGIYTINLASGRSQLIAHGDWSVGEEEPSTWEDPTQTQLSPLRFRLPEASFAADASALALVDRDRIDVYVRDEPGFSFGHVGVCPAWAWAPTGARFVAGCEDMTSAWLMETVCCDAGLGARSLPIESPTLPDDFFDGWEQAENRAIGFTADGDIRITRTYGFATGCEGPEVCSIPPPAWGVTTIDTVTRAAVHELHETTSLFDDGSRLSADASWLYGLLHDGVEAEAVTLDLATHKIRRVSRPGMFAGAASDGSALYGWETDGSNRVAIQQVTRDSTTTVATIDLPDEVVSGPVSLGSITVVALWVGAAT